MFSGLFSRTKKTTKTLLLIDVGSGSVGGGLARLNSKGNPTLLYTTREEIPMRLTRSGAELQEDILKSVKKVIEDVRKKAALWNEGQAIVPQHIDQVAFFLAAPWSATTIKTLHFSRTKPFRMTKVLLERMLTEEAKAAKELQRGQTTIVERTAIALKLNGYKVEEIADASVLSSEVTLATTLAHNEFCTALLKETEQLKGRPETSFHSFSIPASQALLQLMPSIGDALILDVGAEITEALLIKQGAPSGRATAPVGTNIFMRTLRSHAHMEKKEAESAIVLATKDGTRLSKQLKGPLDDSAKLWIKNTEEALRPLSHLGLPQNIYLFADQKAQPWLTSILSTVNFASLYSGALLKVTSISKKDFELRVDNKDTGSDVFLLTELLYADSRFDEGHALSLLSTQDIQFGSHRATIVQKPQVPQNPKEVGSKILIS